MIKINTEDSILDIVRKIKESWKDDIILDFPFWHPILHNYLSLKTLKDKYSKWGLTIITNDLTSRKIWKPLWIEYSIIKDKDFFEKSDYKQNLMKHNFTLWEYLKYIVKKYYREFIDFILFNRKSNSISRYRKKSDSKSNLWFFFLSLLIAIILFLFIFYFAVNKTIIYITPEIDVRVKSRNFIFKESPEWEILKSDKYVELKPISEEIHITKKFSATGIKPDSAKKAEWKVIFFNKFPNEMKLLPKTRLVTASWVLFETKTRVTIPPWKIDNSWNITPWETEIEIIAQTYDTMWNFIWSKWNIWKDIELLVPWLSEEDQKKVYAISSTEISWWDDDYNKIILKSDIENSRDILENELRTEWLKRLKQKISEYNKENDTDAIFEILWIDNITKYSNFNILNIEDIKEWKEIDNFELDWSLIATTYIYDKKNVLDKLRNTIRKSILEWIEDMWEIDITSLTISDEISRIEEPISIKATVSINYLVSYNFENNQNEYQNRLKNKIVWLNKEEAIKLLLNDKKISSVDIQIRPFFIKKLPNILDNIIFEVEE